MLYIKIYKKDSWNDAYLHITFISDDVPNTVFYQINFLENKIRSVEISTTKVTENNSLGESKYMDDVLKTHSLYRSFTLNLPWINPGNFLYSKVFNLV